MHVIDSHAHLNEINDIEGALQRAREAGVDKTIAIGMDLDSNRETLELAQRFPEFVYPAIGYHPWSIAAEQVEENLAFIEENLKHCIALGEIGLDYRAKAKKKFQWQVFSRLLTIGKQAGLPVIIHSRFSHERCHRMAVEASIEKVIFHWYSGPLDILDKIIADGYYISATPALAYSPHHREAIDRAPLEHILIETDAPVEYEGKVTEPADVLLTLHELSRLKNMDALEVAAVTTANAIKFFKLPQSCGRHINSVGKSNRYPD